MDLSTLSDDLRKQIQTLGGQITAEFVAKFDALKLSADEQVLVENAAQVLAAASISSIGADDATRALWKERADTALATLANLSMVKAIDAAAAMRDVVLNAVARAVRIVATALLGAAA